MALEIVTLAEADAYFVQANHPHYANWDGVVVDDDRTGLLAEAERTLQAVYTLSDADQEHKNSVFEQALFYVFNKAASRQRQALQDMGVGKADMIKETYGDNPGLHICAYAKRVLAPVEIVTAKAGVGAVEIERDEDSLI